MNNSFNGFFLLNTNTVFLHKLLMISRKWKAVYPNGLRRYNRLISFSFVNRSRLREQKHNLLSLQSIIFFVKSISSSFSHWIRVALMFSIQIFFSIRYSSLYYYKTNLFIEVALPVVEM